MKKKVLIITYYWPPSGGPGVQRVLKFAKYLHEFGWEPIILTIKNGEYPAIDESLEKDIPPGCKIYKTKSLDPTSFYRKFTGMKKDEKIPVANLAQKNISWKKKISNWIRLNLFIPDAKIGWIPYAVKQGKKIIELEKPDLILSSSPPPTVHLIAKKLAKWSGIKWVADFRDPWTNIYHYDKAKRMALTKNIDKRKEQRVLKLATKIVTVSSSISSSLKIGNDLSKFSVIPNGFDHSDFKVENQVKYPDKFVLCYSGKMNSQQNPVILWKVLSEIIENDEKFSKSFELLLVGNIETDIINQIRNTTINKHLVQAGYVNHNKLTQYLLQSQILLLLIPNTKNNEGIITGKMYEYLATGKFILGIGPSNGDATEILINTNAGRMYEFTDKKGIRTEILEQFRAWQKNVPHVANKDKINSYSRENLTKKLVDLFNDTI